MTTVVNIRKEKCEIYIGRGKDGKIPDPPINGCYGNPYQLSEHGRDESLRLYRIYFNKRIVEDNAFREAVLKLRGKKLGCFCKPLDCHGDIIKEWLDGQNFG